MWEENQTLVEERGGEKEKKGGRKKVSILKLREGIFMELLH